MDAGRLEIGRLAAQMIVQRAAGAPVAETRVELCPMLMSGDTIRAI